MTATNILWPNVSVYASGDYLNVCHIISHLFLLLKLELKNEVILFYFLKKMFNIPFNIFLISGHFLPACSVVLQSSGNQLCLSPPHYKTRQKNGRK